MTIFLSIFYHNEIAVTIHPETKKRTVVAKTRSGTNGALNTTYSDIPETGAVKLYIKAESSKYSLGYAVGENQPKYIAEIENRWLQASLPGWQVFTGSFFGIYSTAGIGLPMLVPAVRTPPINTTHPIRQKHRITDLVILGLQLCADEVALSNHQRLHCESHNTLVYRFNIDQYPGIGQWLNLAVHKRQP